MSIPSVLLVGGLCCDAHVFFDSYLLENISFNARDKEWNVLDMLRVVPHLNEMSMHY